MILRGKDSYQELRFAKICDNEIYVNRGLKIFRDETFIFRCLSNGKRFSAISIYHKPTGCFAKVVVGDEVKYNEQWHNDETIYGYKNKLLDLIQPQMEALGYK